MCLIMTVVWTPLIFYVFIQVFALETQKLICIQCLAILFLRLDDPPVKSHL